MREIALSVVLLIVCVMSSLAQSLDQQERCAQQARRAFQEVDTQDRAEIRRLGNARLSGDYQSHYNTKLGKCLMLVETEDRIGRDYSTTAYVMDANERRGYAIYVWMSRQDKVFWEVPPTACELTPSLREKRPCNSREEFDAFIARLMEE
jgi:hypothetical protein